VEEIRVCSFGGGVNSTAMLVGLVQEGIKVDKILFADTGGEKPHTYQFIKLFDKWLQKNGMPKITVVQSMNINGTYITLESYCFQRNSLPSLAYGFKSCSEKHKIRPQNKYLNNWQPAKDAWKAGRKVIKYVGFDASEDHRIKPYSDDKYDVQYPLVDWGWDREDCVQAVASEELPQPGKSACFFCPSTTKTEILELRDKYPDLYRRAILMEDNADLEKIKGLGRKFSWRDVQDTTEVSPIEQACGCYDG
jgi:hypothetical protein